jgi:uncharacterized protein (TIGR02246 family)
MTHDEHLIRQIVQQFVAAWNAGDSKGIGAFFAEDADFVNILGQHEYGREAIVNSHRYILETVYKGSRNHYEVEDIRFLSDTVGVAFIRAVLEFQEREQTRRLLARPTMVLKKDNDKWQIVAFQNTRIAEPQAMSGADL